MPHSPDHSSYLLWLPKEVKEKLVNLAHDDRMSLNAKINQLILNEIKKRESGRIGRKNKSSQPLDIHELTR